VKKNKIKFASKLHANPHKGKNRTKSSNMWMMRHINDPYVSLAIDKNYRSRAAFKILEIENSFRIFKHAKKILDLGAAPGSWSQIAMQVTNSKSQIVAVDLLEIDPLPGVEMITGNIYDDEVLDKIKSYAEKYDIIMSDIAPNTTGHASTDHLRILDIAENVFELAKEILNIDGHFIIKIFEGGFSQDLIKEIRTKFKTIKRFKPESSRKESPEIYLVAQYYKG
jgi:23S rRNA (uridine2552-2'-O)-methyltransferase